jgi:hypothetical protein
VIVGSLFILNLWRRNRKENEAKEDVDDTNVA